MINSHCPIKILLMRSVISGNMPRSVKPTLIIWSQPLLAHRAGHNISMLSCLWTQLIPTRKILQINVNSSGFLHIYTRKVLHPHSKHYHQHPIYFPLRNHTWSHFGLWQSQVNTLSPIWYLHQNNADPSRFLHIYTRKVSPPHSKHYYKHAIYFPLCNTDFQVRMISATCAFVRLYLFTSYHAKHLSPTPRRQTRWPGVATRVSRSIFMRCHDNACHVIFKSN